MFNSAPPDYMHCMKCMVGNDEFRFFMLNFYDEMNPFVKELYERGVRKSNVGQRKKAMELIFNNFSAKF